MRRTKLDDLKDKLEAAEVTLRGLQQDADLQAKIAEAGKIHRAAEEKATETNSTYLAVRRRRLFEMGVIKEASPRETYTEGFLKSIEEKVGWTWADRHNLLPANYKNQTDPMTELAVRMVMAKVQADPECLATLKASKEARDERDRLSSAHYGLMASINHAEYEVKHAAQEVREEEDKVEKRKVKAQPESLAESEAKKKARAACASLMEGLPKTKWGFLL